MCYVLTIRNKFDGKWSLNRLIVPDIREAIIRMGRLASNPQIIGTMVHHETQEINAPPLLAWHETMEIDA